jgi:hypothetical protein
MNIKYLVVVLACFCISVPLVGQDTSSATIGPFVWSSYANVLRNFITAPSTPLLSPIVSNFTPGQSITVTRVQLHAAVGANEAFNACTVLPAIKVTDGTHSISLQVPAAPTDSAGDFGAVSNDTGPIGVVFPATAKLSVEVVPGDNTSTEVCSATEVNVTVQYRTHP